MLNMSPLKIKINSEIPMTYHHFNQGQDKPLLLFFHGYADSAKALLRRAYPSLDSRYEILAINGLFPVPQKKENEWKQAFAWYFADFVTGSVLIHPDVCAKAVLHLIEKLNLQNRRKIIIGFSQGGFFIPFILPYLNNVEQLVSIGAAYREEDYLSEFTVPLDALHGTHDDVISIEMAEKSFQKLKNIKNPYGKFYRFEGLKHTMNDEARLWLQQKIDSVFQR